MGPVWDIIEGYNERCKQFHLKSVKDQIESYEAIPTGHHVALQAPLGELFTIATRISQP